jgi:hypothetical protein
MSEPCDRFRLDYYTDPTRRHDPAHRYCECGWTEAHHEDDMPPHADRRRLTEAEVAALDALPDAERLRLSEHLRAGRQAEAARAALHGNAERLDGVDRCYCGSKYWEHDRCVDCGGTEVES